MRELDSPPKITKITPTTSIPIQSNIYAYFDKDIIRGEGDILIRDESGGVVEVFPKDSTKIFIDQAMMVINPEYNFEYSKAYKIEFPANSVQSRFGDNMTDAKILNFTTNSGPVLTLGMHDDKHINLILPVTLADGRTYYFMDANGNYLGSGATTDYSDAISHNWLDGLLNNGADTVNTVFDYKFGSDDARSVKIGNYILILPNDEQLAELRKYGAYPGDALYKIGWAGSNHYWSANISEQYSNMHHASGLNGGSVFSVEDGNAFLFAAFEVLFFNNAPT